MLCGLVFLTTEAGFWGWQLQFVVYMTVQCVMSSSIASLISDGNRTVLGQGPYAPQGSASLLPKLSVTSKVRARTSCAWVGSRVHFRNSEDVILLEFTSPVDREYMR